MTAFLVSCSLDVPNIEVCRDKGPLGARCNFTNVGEPRDIPPGVWEQERFGQFCMKEAGFAANQLFFEQACLLVKKCNLETVQKKYAEILKELQK
jgi:hypothetical protein